MKFQTGLLHLKWTSNRNLHNSSIMLVKDNNYNHWVGNNIQLGETEPEECNSFLSLVLSALDLHFIYMCVCVELEKSSCNQKLSGLYSTAALSLPTVSISPSASSYLSSSLFFSSFSLFPLCNIFFVILKCYHTHPSPIWTTK